MVKFKKEWLKILGVESEVQISKISEFKWYKISSKKNLPLDFIEYFADKVEWDVISRYQKLNEPFIRKFAKEVYWDRICYFQKLSESFMKEFAKGRRWYWISKYQTLSEAFVEENADNVVWENIFKYQILSPEFIKKHADKNFDNFSRPDIVFERDILPLNPCHAGAKRFLKFFKKDQLVIWNELLGKYKSVTENKDSYFCDIEWFIR